MRGNGSDKNTKDTLQKLVMEIHSFLQVNPPKVSYNIEEANKNFKMVLFNSRHECAKHMNSRTLYRYCDILEALTGIVEEIYRCTIDPAELFSSSLYIEELGLLKYPLHELARILTLSIIEDRYGKEVVSIVSVVSKTLRINKFYKKYNSQRGSTVSKYPRGYSSGRGSTVPDYPHGDNSQRGSTVSNYPRGYSSGRGSTVSKNVNIGG